VRHGPLASGDRDERVRAAVADEHEREHPGGADAGVAPVQPSLACTRTTRTGSGAEAASTEPPPSIGMASAAGAVAASAAAVATIASSR
jgi:hypothetical protein